MRERESERASGCASAREHVAASERADGRTDGRTGERARARERERDIGRGDGGTEKEKRVPANKKRAAMHSLYSLDINTRQRARNQPRLHRQLLPNDTDTHTRSLIVIKQKKEQREGWKE